MSAMLDTRLHSAFACLRPEWKCAPNQKALRMLPSIFISLKGIYDVRKTPLFFIFLLLTFHFFFSCDF